MLEEGLLLADRYRIHELIGSGGSGWVYRATQEPLGRPVAVKVLRTDLPQEDQQHFEARFLREASLAGSLQHPHIVTIHDYGRSPEGFCYLVMEYLDGFTLREVLRRHNVPVKRLVRIFDGLAQGLRHAHGRGLVHRDVKPSNVFLVRGDGEEWRPKLMDFGLVREVHSDVTVTEVGTFLGTPQYIAPEQAMGQHADARSDVYSMGVMLYRALCGKLPYAATNPAALAYMHVHEPYPSMGERAPGVDVSSRLESICMRCMKKDPAERFSDAGAFLEKLRATSRFVLGPDVLPPPDKSASRVAAVALKVPELPVPPEQDLTPRIDTEETDFPEDTDITDAMGPPPPLPPRDEAPPPVPVPVHDLGEPGLVDSGSSSRMLRIMLSAAAVVVLFCGGLGAGLQLFFAEGVAAFEDGLLQALEREEAQAVLPVEPHGPAPVLTDVVQTEELPEVEAAVEVAQQPEPPDSEPVAIAPEPAPGLPPRDGARQAALDSIREVLDEPAVQPPPVEESVVDAVAAIEPTRAEVEPSAGGGSDLGLSIVGASGHEESPQPLVIPPPEPPGVVIQPSSGDLPPPAPQRGTVTADEVSFTADEAAATLNWINTASEKELKASGIYSLGVTNILTQRPYQSIEVFAATHYVGPKSVQAAKYAALR